MAPELGKTSGSFLETNSYVKGEICSQIPATVIFSFFLPFLSYLWPQDPPTDYFKTHSSLPFLDIT